MDLYFKGELIALTNQEQQLLELLFDSEGRRVPYERVDRVLFDIDTATYHDPRRLTGRRSAVVRRVRGALDRIEPGAGRHVATVRDAGLTLTSGLLARAPEPARAHPASGTGYPAPRLSRAAVRHLRAYYRPAPGSPEADLGGTLLTSLLPRRALEYPVLFFPAHPDHHGQVISSILPRERVDCRDASVIRADRLRIRDPRLRIERYRHAHPTTPVKDVETFSHQGLNLCMTGLRRGPTGYLELSARLAHYGDIMDSADCMIDEISRAGDGRGGLDPDALTLRNTLGRTSLVCPEGRAAGIGLAALIAYVDPDNRDLRGLIGRRSFQVGTYADTWHVIPAGMLNYRFGATRADARDDAPWGNYESCDVAYSIISEYVEEAFNKDDELDGNARRAAVLRQSSVQWLMENHAEVFVTGVAVDLGNLRPEICILIYVGGTWIDTPAGREAAGSFVLNPEYVVPQKVRALQLEKPLLAADGSGGEFLDPADTVPSGAAAFWSGSALARRIYEDDIAGGRWRGARGDRFTVATALRRLDLPSRA